MSSVKDALLAPRGYQKITAPAAATALTIPADGASRALIKVETQTIRWKDDTGLPGATAVTATDGMLVDIGDELFYTGDLNKLRIIETAAGAVVHIMYYA